MINILDVIILGLIIICGVLGLKKGALQCGVSFVGLVLSIVIAYALKNVVANFLITHLPFFDFGGSFKGVSVLNILIYEAIAFGALFSILSILLKLIINLSGILERFLSSTIILGIPSKILGLILGLLEGYIYAFVVVFVLSLFNFSIELTQNSKLNSSILNNTPILSNIAIDAYDSVSEIYSLKDKYEEIDDTDAYNYAALEILLKHDVVTKDTVEILVEQGKLEISNIDSLLEQY